MDYIQINKETPLKSKFRVDPDDPKKIASTIAQCPPPPTAELRDPGSRSSKRAKNLLISFQKSKDIM
ncbi:hypothetical protein DPMN_186509 [Dreissena polymorpha]|uniref:Uncharacterized protein n=1 Tax=Dreissena polymorpha TaxID=45954 RepID=A0A9D4I9M5_DREPO|nr:hypothetical protein DPMN_186509 [Dreissena polymorpha]